MYGLDYYVENTAAVQYSFDLFASSAVRPHCIQTWVMLGLWPFIFAGGLAAQCLKTGQKDHKRRPGKLSVFVGFLRRTVAIIG